MPSSAGKGYYPCNTTKIDRVEQPRTVCGVVPRSAEECRVVLGRGGADIGEPLNYSTTIAEECRVVPGRGGADIGEPLNYSTMIAIPLK